MVRHAVLFAFLLVDIGLHAVDDAVLLGAVGRRRDVVAGARSFQIHGVEDVFAKVVFTEQSPGVLRDILSGDPVFFHRSRTKVQTKEVLVALLVLCGVSVRDAATVETDAGDLAGVDEIGVVAVIGHHLVQRFFGIEERANLRADIGE